jgi:iron(III) transport system substrate-binding protein
MGDASWATLEAIGKSNVNMQTSAGNMVKSVLSGEAAVGYFVSGISVFPKFPEAEPVMGWTYDTSGQVVMIRGMGITKKAVSPASAKLLMEFILSAEGQLAWSEGGLTAYRPDIAGQAEHHLQGIIDAVGADNVIYFTFDPEIAVAANRQAFVDKWKPVMGRP